MQADPAPETITPSTAPEDGAPRQLLPRAERQEAILRGAAQAFARAGFAATSMDDVAAASGITKLIVYRHFDSKEELYRAVLQRVSGRLVEEFVHAVRRGDRRGVAARAQLRVAREDPHGFALLMRHAIREEAFADYVQAFHAQAVGLARTLVETPLRGTGLEVWAAETVISHLVDAVLHWIDHGEPDRDDDFAAMVTDGLTALVAAWGSASSR